MTSNQPLQRNDALKKNKKQNLLLNVLNKAYIYSQIARNIIST